MHAPAFRFALILGSLAAGSAALASAKATQAPPSLTLYEKADFTGRHVSFKVAADTARQAFDAKSARSVGVWTLCEGKDPASKCQTVNGDAAKLKIAPALVRPGVDAVALYEEPGLKGRRVVYSFASDQPPPFKAKSARTWGGAWTLCDTAGDRCQTIDGDHPAAVEIAVSQVEPVRPVKAAEPAARLQIALAAPPPPEPETAPPPPALAVEPAPPPPSVETPQPQSKAAPAEPEAVLAEATPPKTEPAPSPYIEIPLPPRVREAAAQDAAPAPQAPLESAEVRIPPPARAAPVLRRVAYVCEDGRGLTVLFDDRDETAMVLTGGREPVAMRRSQEREQGGFFYEGGGHVLFGAGLRAGFATDGTEAVDCYARGARRQLSSRDDRPYRQRFSYDERSQDELDEGPDPNSQGNW